MDSLTTTTTAATTTATTTTAIASAARTKSRRWSSSSSAPTSRSRLLQLSPLTFAEEGQPLCRRERNSHNSVYSLDSVHGNITDVDTNSCGDRSPSSSLSRSSSSSSPSSVSSPQSPGTVVVDLDCCGSRTVPSPEYVGQEDCSSCRSSVTSCPVRHNTPRDRTLVTSLPPQSGPYTVLSSPSSSSTLSSVSSSLQSFIEPTSDAKCNCTRLRDQVAPSDVKARGHDTSTPAQAFSGRKYSGKPVNLFNKRNYKSGAMGLSSLLRTFLLYACVAFLVGPVTCDVKIADMSITAFEYQRKFHKALEMGECPQREVQIQDTHNSTHIEEQRCSVQQRGTVSHHDRGLNDSRNVLIESASSIVAYLGLCGGEAASFLGILNNGDCVAVEIASRLTFNEKTMVRAFVGYYRKSLDVLDRKSDNEVTEGMDRYYRDKVYLKHRSYGTLEIIFVQFRFKSAKLATEARKVELHSTTMSDYMAAIEKKVGTPRRTTVINLSTATQESYEIRRFQANDWSRAVRHVKIKQMTTDQTRDKINKEIISPHLMYRLSPFVDTATASMRSNSPIPWEKTSILEVQLRHLIGIAKKTSKKCRKNRKKPCRRTRELRRLLISARAEIHKGRSSWHKMTTEEKLAFQHKYTGKLKQYSNVTEILTKRVRMMRKREKMDRLRQKETQPNEVLSRKQLSRRRSKGKASRLHRRIRHRHARRRMKVSING